MCASKPEFNLAVFLRLFETRSSPMNLLPVSPKDLQSLPLPARFTGLQTQTLSLPTLGVS